MAMSPELLNLFESDLAAHLGRQRDDIYLAVARQRDGAAYDMRALGAFTLGNLFTSDDPERMAGLNAGVRIPTTLTHPNAVVMPDTK